MRTLARIGLTLMTLALIAALATIWWDGNRWQSGATAVLLFITAASCLGTAGNHTTTKETDQ